MSKKENKKPIPSHRIYSVVEKDDGTSDWTEIGAAWKHSDGKGFSLTFKARPLADAQIVLREPKPKKVETKAFEQEAA